MIEFAKKGAVFIAKMIKDNGKLIYEFDTRTNKVYKKYNMLRHFGCIYAMLEIYPYLTDKEKILIKNSSRRALSWAINKKVIEIKNQFAVLEKGKIKLGANALAMLSFIKWFELFGDATLFEGFFPSQILLKLSEFLLDQINKDGSLKFHKFDYKTKTPDDFSSNFYPGEIMLAFTMMSEITAGIETSILINSAISVMQWLREHRDRHKQVRDHWQLQAMERLYGSIFVERKYDEYISKYARRIAKVEPITPEKFDSVPSGPLGARTEGLMAYYKINPEKWTMKEIDKNIKRLKKFQISKGKYAGGFLYKLNSHVTRIDHTQHASLALLECWRIKNES